MIWIIQQNNRFRPKCYPIFRFRPKFRLNNWFRHSRGRNKISNFGLRLNRNRNQKLIFGFGSRCFISNFGCSLPQDLSHLRGTGPILFNKIGPVPNWTFSWINTILSLIWARSHGFLLMFAPTISPFSAVQLYKKQYKLLKVSFYSEMLILG